LSHCRWHRGGKLEELDKLDTLKTSEVQQLLDITRLNVKEDLLDLNAFAGELGNLEKLSEDLVHAAHALNELRRGLEDDPTTRYHVMEFFGAHNQVVSKPGTEVKQTGTASDDESSEAAESAFGVPIITTQFHPEVGAKGFPNAKFFYKKTGVDQQMDLDIFRYFDKAGDAYSKKKTVIDELTQFKPEGTAEDKDVDVTPNIKPTDILKAKQKLQEQEAHFGEEQQKKTSLFRKVISAITSFFKAIGSAISSVFTFIKETARKSVGKFARKAVSDKLTESLVSRQRKREEEHYRAEDIGVEKEALVSSSSSFSIILNDIKTKAPSEILRETPAKLWTKQDDELDENVVNKTAVDKTERAHLQAGQEIGEWSNSPLF